MPVARATPRIARLRSPLAVRGVTSHRVPPGRSMPEGERHSADAFRRLIDMASDRGGSYFLTYHRHATREQVEACHLRFQEEFLARKERHDPGGLFDSDWHRHHVAHFGGS